MKVQNLSLRLYLLAASYTLMLLALMSYIDSDFAVPCAVFLIANFIVSFFFVVTFRLSLGSTAGLLVYLAFFFSFVFKAMFLPFFDIDSYYNYITVRTVITHEGFSKSLMYVTFAHSAFSLLISGSSKISFQGKNGSDTSVGEPITAISRPLILVASAWILFSSIIMVMNGVALMGTAGVSLPFKLSGIFYYSRTTFLPLLFLYYLQAGLCGADRKLVRMAFGALVFLAFNEMIVRTTKAPLIILALQASFLLIMLRTTGHRLTTNIGRKQLAALLLLGLLVWPVMEAYRSVMVGQRSEYVLFELLVERASEQQGYIQYIAERFLQRLVGVLQFSGLVSDGAFHHDAAAIVSQANLAEYYTRDYLNYFQEGHHSSPSLLGAGLILFGHSWWLVVPMYWFLTLTLWRVSEIFTVFTYSIKCVLAIELVNTVFSGTIFSFGYRALILFGCAAFLEILNHCLNLMQSIRGSRQQISLQSD